MTGTGVAMTDKLGTGAQAERARRRKFWGTLGALGAGAMVLGIVAGYTEAHQRANGVIGTNPVLAYALVGSAVIAFSYGSWLFFRKVDEVEVADNLWASLLGFYAYIVLLPAWTILSRLGVATEPSNWVIYFASSAVATVGYFGLKLRRR